jgi:hypothetical protein
MSEQLTDLYGAPLDQFVARRNQLAKELKAEGRDDDAAAVTSLRKPTTVIWGLDQLAETAPELIDELTAAHERLRTAASAEKLRSASDDRHRLVQTLVDIAAERLETAGLGASEQTRERMARTLLATASDPDAEKALRAGTLATELQPSGFGGPVAEFEPSPVAAAEKPPARMTKALARAEELAGEVTRLVTEVAVLEKEAKEARRAADQADRAVHAARRHLDQKRRQAEKARAATEK